MADGLRAVYLKPDWTKGHLRYIQGLDGCGKTEEAAVARKKFVQLFPSKSDTDLINSGNKGLSFFTNPQVHIRWVWLCIVTLYMYTSTGCGYMYGCGYM